MNRCIVALAIAMLLAAVACASPEQKAEKAKDSVASWAAVQKMTAEEWRRGAVTDGYVRSTARVAIAELEQLDAPGRDEALRAWRELLERAQQKR
jgi:hypothetical protein